MSANSSKKPPGGDYETRNFSLYPKDVAIIKACQRRGDEFDFRLDWSKAMRVVLRAVRVDQIPREAFEEIAKEVSVRRKKK